MKLAAVRGFAIFLILCGGLLTQIEELTIRATAIQPSKSWVPPESLPWVLITVGIVIILWSITLPSKISAKIGGGGGKH